MDTRLYTDMIGNEITVSYPAKRIISLVPSQTELLHDLGLEDEVVGITKFCVHPNQWFRTKKKVGGTKNINLDIVTSLQPGLIIANKEENTKDQIEAISQRFPVWVSNITTIEEALVMIQSVGDLTGRSEIANILMQEIQQGFAGLQKKILKRVAYFIWRNPWMCAGGDTFINNMIETIGWHNVFARKLRYPEINLTELSSQNIDLILLSSEPYPFKEAHIQEIKAVLPGVEVLLVDGEMFSWYGSRMKYAIPYLQQLIKK